MQIAHLLFIKAEIRQVYNPFWNQILHYLSSIIFSEDEYLKSYPLGGGGMGEPSIFCLGSVISVFTCISKYITWISKQ